MMIMVCNTDNEQGKPYVHYVTQDEVWREGSTCKARDDAGTIHTAYFESEYEAAMFINYVEYDETIKSECDDHAKVFIGFLTEIWSPGYSDKCWHMVLWMSRIPLHSFAHVPSIIRYSDFPDIFIEYVIDAMIEAGYIRRYGDILMNTDVALIALLRHRIGDCNG